MAQKLFEGKGTTLEEALKNVEVAAREAAGENRTATVTSYRVSVRKRWRGYIAGREDSDAQEALRIGLVNEVVPQGDLISTAMAMAQVIASKGQIAIRMALKAINATMEVPLSEGLKIEAALFGECCGTEDAKEGIGAFLQKRKPAFKRR